MEFLKIWEILLRRKWLVVLVFLGFFIAVVFGSQQVTPTYESTAKILVKSSGALSSLLSRLDIKTSKEEDDDSYDTDIALAKIRPLLDELISSLDLTGRKGEAIEPDKLVKGGLLTKIFPRPVLKVEQYGDTALLEITAESPEAEEAAAMANELADLYLAARIRTIRGEYKEAFNDIDDQVKRMKSEYYDFLNKSKDFMIEEGSIDLDQEIKQVLEKISSLKENAQTNNIQIKQLEREIAQAKEELKTREVFRKESREFGKNTSGKQLEKTLADLLIEISGKSVELNRAHPEYQQMEKEIEKAKEIIKEKAYLELEAERFGVDPVVENLSKTLVDSYINKEMALVKKRLLNDYLDEYQDKLFQLPLKYIKNEKLNLALSIIKKSYSNLLEYQMQLGVAQSVSLSNIKLVEPAVIPEKPDFPSKPLSYGMALFLGLFCSLALAFFREYIDNTIKTPDDVKQHTAFKMLGTVPWSRGVKKQGTTTGGLPDTYVLEAYRRVRNNIKYVSGNRPLQVMMITSSVSGEGNTSLACNLAMTLAGEKNKIAVVDLHFRNPGVHKYFGLQNVKGVTDILLKDIPVNECMYKEKNKNLWILTSGFSPLDSGHVLESDGFRNLIQQLRLAFDTVIIDSPPMIPLNDGLTISESADGVVYVAESGKATVTLLETAHENLETANVPVLGLVLNKLKKPALIYARSRAV